MQKSSSSSPAKLASPKAAVVVGILVFFQSEPPDERFCSLQWIEMVESGGDKSDESNLNPVGDAAMTVMAISSLCFEAIHYLERLLLSYTQCVQREREGKKSSREVYLPPSSDHESVV